MKLICGLVRNVLTIMTNLDDSKLVALKLSSLNESDFNWVFSQLEQDAKNKLTPLLSEIKDIGIKVESEDINRLIKNNVNYGQESKQLINDASYDELAEIFRSESPLVFNTLIGLEKWHWTKSQKFIERPRTNATKVIKNIKSKELLQKSIISTTASMIMTSSASEKYQIDSVGFKGSIRTCLNKLLKMVTK